MKSSASSIVKFNLSAIVDNRNSCLPSILALFWSLSSLDLIWEVEAGRVLAFAAYKSCAIYTCCSLIASVLTVCSLPLCLFSLLAWRRIDGSFPTLADIFQKSSLFKSYTSLRAIENISLQMSAPPFEPASALRMRTTNNRQ